MNIFHGSVTWKFANGGYTTIRMIPAGEINVARDLMLYQNVCRDH